MSRRTCNSPPSPPLNREPGSRTQFPKWNRPASTRALPAVAGLLVPVAFVAFGKGIFAISNCHAREKLENPVTLDHSATSIFLIDNFDRFGSNESSSRSPLATASLIAEIWKIRNRRNLLKTKERSRF